MASRRTRQSRAADACRYPLIELSSPSNQSYEILQYPSVSFILNQLKINFAAEGVDTGDFDAEGVA